MKNRFVKCIGISALAVTLMMSGSVSHAAENTASDTQEATAAEVSDDSSDENKLPAPTGLHWDGWSPAWDEVDASYGYYIMEVYNNDTLYHEDRAKIGSSESSTIVFSRFMGYLNDSGVYKFRVKTVNNYYAVSKEDSDWSEFSEEKTYVKPEAQLGTTIGWWDSETAGMFRFNAIDGASRYDVILYKDGVSRVTAHSANTYTDFSSDIAKYGEGKYTVTVRAISSDVDTVANGVEGEQSEVFDTASLGEDVSDTINSAVTDNNIADSNASSTESTVQNIVDSTGGLANLGLAMQTDSTVLNQIAQLEETMKAEKGITVSEAALSEEAENLVDKTKINMVGAALSAESGYIGLEITVPAEKKDVSTNNYINSVQLDIKLVNNGVQVNTLKAPITITMPIPSGITSDRLTILHYSEDGSYETAKYKNNGDGTVTFTVTHFSTFVFANEKDDTTDNTETEDDTEDNTGDTTEETTEASDASAKSVSPKTGEDSLPAAVPFTTAVVMTCGALIIGKKYIRNK